MSDEPSGGREALLAELIGDVGRLLDRADSLAASLDSMTKLIEQTALVTENRLAVLIEGTKTAAVNHVARRSEELARAAVHRHTASLQTGPEHSELAQVSAHLSRLEAALDKIARQQVSNHVRDHWRPAAVAAAVGLLASLAAVGVVAARLPGLCTS